MVKNLQLPNLLPLKARLGRQPDKFLPQDKFLLPVQLLLIRKLCQKRQIQMVAQWFNHLPDKALLVPVRVQLHPQQLDKNLRQVKVRPVKVKDRHKQVGKSLRPQVLSLQDRADKPHRLQDKVHKQFLVLNLHFRKHPIRMEPFKRLPELRFLWVKDQLQAKLPQADRNLLPVRLLLVKFLLLVKHLPDRDQQVRLQPVKHQPVKTLNFQKLRQNQVPEPHNFRPDKQAPPLVPRPEPQPERLRVKNLDRRVRPDRPDRLVLRQLERRLSIPVLQLALRLVRTLVRREHHPQAPRQILDQQMVRPCRPAHTPDFLVPSAMAPQILQTRPFRKDSRIRPTQRVNCQPVRPVRLNCRLVQHSFQREHSRRRQVTQRPPERYPPIRRAPCKKLSIQMHQPSAPLPVPPSLQVDKPRRFKRIPTRLPLLTSRSRRVQVMPLPAAV